MRTLHVISHTHWDREWYQTFQQFRLKLVQLVDGLFDILESDPDFKYFMLDGQTIVLEDYLQMRPEKEELLRGYIQSGRIVIGPWHILPDMFLPGPESHIRNLLEGGRTSQHFGAKMMVGYMPDSFGHIGQMPQILRGFGIENACLWRGLDEEPAEFWWQSPDGSQVLMAYLRDSYSNGALLPGESGSEARFAEGLAEQGQSLAAHAAAADLLIMLGTDHMQPPRTTSKNLAYASKSLTNFQPRHSTLEQYFTAIRSSLANLNIPVVTGELRNPKRMHLLPGVLSTRIWIKQHNTASENMLTKWVEPFSTFAELMGTGGQKEGPNLRLRTPATLIRQTWRLLMENHPHDSICGCCIDQVHDEMKVRFDQVDQISEELTRQSLEVLGSRINTAQAAHSALDSVKTTDNSVLGSVIVFNPSGFLRTDLVSAEVSLGPGINDFVLLDDTGRQIPYETLGLGARELINASMNPKEFRTAFSMVNDGRVTGLGVRSYEVKRSGSAIELDVTLIEGEPDRKVWEQALVDINQLFADSSISSYHVRAHTPDLAKLAFTASEVPALGWQTFIVQARSSESEPVKLSSLARVMLPVIGRLARLPAGQRLIANLQSGPAGKTAYTIENEFFRVDLEPAGTLTILDKRSGIRLRGQNNFIDSGDCGDEYNYSPPAVNPQYTARLKSASVQHGVCQTLRISLILKTSSELSTDRLSRSRQLVEIPITTVITLTRGVARIDIQTHIKNLAKDHRLRAHFPTPFRPDKAFYDGHFEIVERKLGIPSYDRQTWAEDPRPEAPQRAFTALYEGDHGLTLANRGLPEVEVLKTAAGTEIALTLLRCVGWLSRDDLQTRRGHAGPGLETPGAQMMSNSLENWEFNYSLIPHAGPTIDLAARQAYSFETPLRAVAAPLQHRQLPCSGSFLQVETNHASQDTPLFIISTVKQTEDGSGWIVRGYNPTKNNQKVRLKPHEHFEFASEVNLVEQKIRDLEIDPGGAVNLEVGSNKVVTVRFDTRLQ